MIPQLFNSNWRIILIQIQEAHSKSLPLGMNNHPDLQTNLYDRVQRANEFNKKLIENNINLQDKITSKAIRVVIDTWNDEFENIYQCWPDKFYALTPYVTSDAIPDANANTPQYKIIKKSIYSLDAIIEEDYTDYLHKIITM